MQTVQDKSFCVIPVFKNGGNFLFCVVQHGRGDHWGFPKGHAESNETEEETALRELLEETSIKDIQIVPGAVFTQGYVYEHEGIIYDKTVKYFLGLVSSTDTSIPEEFKAEISEVKWLPYQELRELITYENAKVLLDEVQEYLEKNPII